ncbi:MAG: helix-hairpin-helix domain-containing protein [Candidatus Delongbacteria bacterium]
MFKPGLVVLKPLLTPAERSSLAVLFSLIAAGYLVLGWRYWREPERPVTLNRQDVAFVQQGVRVFQSAPADSGQPAAAGPKPVLRTGPLDLNRADSLALLDLPGIGPTKVGAMLEWRRRHGRFRQVDDLLKVKGIGPGTLKRLRDQVRVADDSSVPGKERGPGETPAAEPGAK